MSDLTPEIKEQILQRWMKSPRTIEKEYGGSFHDVVHQARIDTRRLLQETESQKSITDLAVKALELYADEDNWTTAYYHSEFGKAQVQAMYKSTPWRGAQSTLLEIRRLTDARQG